ncbi:enoyl-CoA hydratase/isomerase family protein [Amycolatopsis thermoflava]|uniref:enoyl-CoA hydratase/isomerase family protein n=1 Tax=Amycolatopsis thermoflava TaxID=84480 RepID=UPI003EBCFEC2
MPAQVQLDCQDGVLTVMLNRPESGNGLDFETGKALLAAVADGAADTSVRVIVLLGSGGIFCSGDDLDSLRKYADGDVAAAPASADTADAFYVRICEEIVLAPKPVLAAVNGVAIGPGAEIACAADLRIGGPGSRIGCGLIRVGHVGIGAMLRRVVGPARATEIFLSGRLVGADEAHRIGLLDRLVREDEQVVDEALRLARDLACGPTKAIALYKELRERSIEQPVLSALRMQDRFHRRSHAEVADSDEGLRALLHGRKPHFTGH